MPGSHFARSIVLVLCGALAAFGCASTDTERGATGSLSLDLVLAGDIEIDVVDWEITGNGMDMGGSVDVSGPGSTASVEVFGLPVGQEPYVVELSAVSVDQQVNCRGSAEFDVEVGVSTPVMVILNCKLPQELGGVRVNGKFNICAQLTKMVVAPLQTSVGNDISLFSTASDEEGDPITYMWSSQSGSIADPIAASTTYTCTEVGDDDITVLVTDDDGSYCMSMWTVRVTCVAGEGNPCDDVTCEDDGNECTSEACNPGTGQCETSNVADGTDCDGGAGMCSAGTCVAKELCMDVVCEDDGNECTSETCNPDTGQCETSNVENGTSCNDASGMCMNGDCVTNDLCMDVVCDDTGNDCTAAECDPSTGQCETSNVANGTVCEGSAVELAVNGGFETGNLDGWTQFCTENNGTCAATTDEANTGSWSGNLVASVPEGGPASFPLIKNANIGIGTVTPNSPISISFAVKGELTGISGQVVAEFFSEQLPEGTSKSEILQIITPTSEWVTYSFETTTGPVVDNGVTLQLKVECGAVPGCGNNTYFDDVSVTFGSGGGAGTCQEGVCEPDDLCEGVDCDDQNECTIDTCDAGNCSNTPDTGASCDGDAGTCDAQGVCQPNDLCIGVDCDDNNECTIDTCDAGNCSNTPDTGASCDGDAGTCDAQGVCQPNVEPEYTQDFEGLAPTPSNSLVDDGWLGFVNQFSPDGQNYLGGYVKAPGTEQGGLAAIETGQGGDEQGLQVLAIISDYNNDADQNAGNLVEANTFQQRLIVADDVGKTVTFSFDAKLGNLTSPSTANAFIKTFFNPGALIDFLTVDTTAIPATWNRYSISLVITQPLVGATLQFGFSATASNFVASQVFYDNVLVTLE